MLFPHGCRTFLPLIRSGFRPTCPFITHIGSRPIPLDHAQARKFNVRLILLRLENEKRSFSSWRSHRKGKGRMEGDSHGNDGPPAGKVVLPPLEDMKSRKLLVRL